MKETKITSRTGGAKRKAKEQKRYQKMKIKEKTRYCKGNYKGIKCRVVTVSHVSSRPKTSRTMWCPRINLQVLLTAGYENSCSFS